MCAADAGGCFIKVFDTLSTACLYSFKRGIKACTISNMCFDFENAFLAVSSSADTVHVFFLRPTGGDPASESTAASSQISKSTQSRIVETGFKLFSDLKVRFPLLTSSRRTSRRRYRSQEARRNFTLRSRSAAAGQLRMARSQVRW